MTLCTLLQKSLPPTWTKDQCAMVQGVKPITDADDTAHQKELNDCMRRLEAFFAKKHEDQAVCCVRCMKLIGINELLLDTLRSGEI